MAAGAEYALVANQKVKMAVRAGYNTRNVSSKLGGITGINAGAGLDFGGIIVDYAWSLYGDLGSTHRFSLTAKFGNSEKKTGMINPTVLENPAAPAQIYLSEVKARLEQLKSPDW